MHDHFLVRSFICLPCGGRRGDVFRVPATSAFAAAAAERPSPPPCRRVSIHSAVVAGGCSSVTSASCAADVRRAYALPLGCTRTVAFSLPRAAVIAPLQDTVVRLHAKEVEALEELLQNLSCRRKAGPPPPGDGDRSGAGGMFDRERESRWSKIAPPASGLRPIRRSSLPRKPVSSSPMGRSARVHGHGASAWRSES